MSEIKQIIVKPRITGELNDILKPDFFIIIPQFTFIGSIINHIQVNFNTKRTIDTIPVWKNTFPWTIHA